MQRRRLAVVGGGGGAVEQASRETTVEAGQNPPATAGPVWTGGEGPATTPVGQAP